MPRIILVAAVFCVCMLADLARFKLSKVPGAR